ncbi:hypothetical protein [Erythrobacter sp. HL-111]|uniref:hypothetical protein n=1 Tax=Erythrobacter sp. HL-111 TaxID=1798193 RepID=UPI0006DB45A2|nr:hypothetical protein [Erythrobacter sp. HL-111]KPP93408.1 MAG: Outer membrane receptor for ferrienterochelin and colicins [Erythrobacteraceae bacterium HL-111]SDR70332.1 Outer membrane receptor for ferrienterochelin and colicins [Erythrobacter sp. HL-111]
MNRPASLRPPVRALLASSALAFALGALPAAAQQAEEGDESAQAPVPQEAEDDPIGSGGEIVVRAQRLRGQLDVEQAPLLELGEEAIAAEGVASISDLIQQIEARTGSARGRGGERPIVLVNGIRVGSFREFAQYPPEALARVEVFPEEVAQRFGFPPDRRVINLILKDNYDNAEVELEFEGPSRGGYFQTEQELGYLRIADGGRINVNLTANDRSLLTEAERGIIQTPGSTSDLPGDPDQAEFRSLLADTRSFDANVSYAKAFIDQGASVSANINYQRNDSRALNGLNLVTLTGPDGDSLTRTFGEETPLTQTRAEDVLNASGSLNKQVNAFQYTGTFDAGLSELEQVIDRRFDTSALEAEALAGTLALDGPLPGAVAGGFDVANTRGINAATLHTLNGPLADLPGGELMATFDVGYDWSRVEASDTRGNLPVNLTRGDISTGANLVVPITSRRRGFADALGSFTLNLNAGINDLSDFGTLGDYSVGLNWGVTDRFELSATYIYREVAPGLRQLGDPQVLQPNVPVFDLVAGETVLAEVLTGGNPDLPAETQTDWRFQANWELPFWDDTRFTIEYIRNRSDDVTSAFPQVTPAIEAAFPDRIGRDADGRLTFVDRRAVRFAETRSDRLQFTLGTRGRFGDEAERGGPPGGAGERAGGRMGRPSGAPAAGTAGAERGGPPAADRRERFMAFRDRLCAEDGAEWLADLVARVDAGEDLSEEIPGFDPARLEAMVARARGADGTIDEDRLAMFRERICAIDPAVMGGRAGPPVPADGSPRVPGGGERTPEYEAFRARLCGEGGIAALRELIARIEAGEDVSALLPGVDPALIETGLDRARGPDGTIPDAVLERFRTRMCEMSARGGQSGGEARDGDGGDGRDGGGGGGGGPAFNPLGGGGRPGGFFYFANLTHTIELANEILIAPGVPVLDQLDGDATDAFGLPRHSSRLEAGIFGQGLGLRLSGRYTGRTRLDGSGLPGSTDLFFGDIVTFDLRVFANLDQVTRSEAKWLDNVRVSLRADNLFDAQRRVRDEAGNVPINYQPLLIDPTGLFVGIDIRKLF